jgi:TrpR-related protein YerC/YecD
MEVSSMKPKITPDARALFEAVLSLENIEECAAFFDDVCTIKEIQDLSQRYAVARLLDKGEKYQSIEEATGASTATISRVNKCLAYGSGGYRSAIKKAKNRENVREEETV